MENDKKPRTTKDANSCSRFERWRVRAASVDKALEPLGGKDALLDAAESCIQDLPRGHNDCYLEFKGQHFFVSYKGLSSRRQPTEIFVYLECDPSVIFAYRWK